MANQGTVINGRDGTADIMINSVSYKCMLNMFEVESNVEMSNADVFCIEGTVDQEAGREQLRFRVMGVMKKGVSAAGPMIPAPQNVPVTFTFSTGCTISIPLTNWFRARAVRVVNQNGIIEGEGLSKGAFTVTWNTTTP